MGVSNFNCDLPCPGNKKMCGGGDNPPTYTVYQVAVDWKDVWTDIDKNFGHGVVGTIAWMIGYGVSELMKHQFGVEYADEAWDAVWKREGLWPHVFQNLWNFGWTSVSMLLQAGFGLSRSMNFLDGYSNSSELPRKMQAMTEAQRMAWLQEGITSLIRNYNN